MPVSEGRNDPFSVMKTWFAKAPRLVVYDFACALEEYCLNRDPIYFKDTQFVIDRFHWKNHIGLAFVSAITQLFAAARRLSVSTTIRAFGKSTAASASSFIPT